MTDQREAGYSLVAVMAAITIMSIASAAALPAWKYVMQNEREEELIFRGGQIADAIRRFQTKNGNALPASMDVLVKGKFLRKPFKDPMSKTGEWRLLRQTRLRSSITSVHRGETARRLRFGLPAP